MDNPDDKKITINVKGVSEKAWEKAKNSANKQGETMGAWLSRAANQLADREIGPRELPPLLSANLGPKMVKPDGLTAPDLAGLLQGLAALATATGTPPAKATIRRVYALADDHVREARGQPPRPISLPRGKVARQAFSPASTDKSMSLASSFARPEQEDRDEDRKDKPSATG